MLAALTKLGFAHSESLAKTQQYCLTQRLFGNIVQLLFQDLLNHYQISFVLICEIIEKNLKLGGGFEEMKQTYYAYKTFVDESVEV